MTLIGSSDGRFAIAFEGFAPNETADYPPGFFAISREAPGTRDHFGFYFHRFKYTQPFGGGDRMDADVPDWFLLLLCASPSARALVAWLNNRKGRCANVCVYCGYDLRATPNRCPECGTIPAQSN
jgi:hypothetical protein